jgi:hypothetical protein
MNFNEFERRTKLSNNLTCESCTDIYEDKYACDNCKKVRDVDEEWDSYGDQQDHYEREAKC